MREELAGWKQIAAYLGVSIPTVRRYAKRHGMPVIQRGGRYFAVPEELEAWRRSPAADEPASVTVGPRRGGIQRLGVAALLLVAALLGAALVHERLSPPASVARATFEGSELVASSDAGDELWRVAFSEMGKMSRGLSPLVRDVDGDGRNDVLLSAEHRFPERAYGRLVCLSDAGEVRWEREYGRELTLAGRTFERAYRGHHLRWLETWMGPLVLAVARHAIWFPSQILLLEPASGEVVSEYWHPGHLDAIELVDLDQDGREELLLGGINNPGPGSGQPSLAVLDLPFGLPTPSARNYFGSGNARERAYLLFPRPDFFSPPELAVVQEIHPLEDRLLAIVKADRKTIYFYFDLDTNLDLLDVEPSDFALEVHADLLAQGLVDHPYCPEELRAWHRLLRFPSAPDGNAAEVRRALSQFRVCQTGPLKERERS